MIKYDLDKIGFEFANYTAFQNWGAFCILSYIFSIEKDINRVVEIGTARGGLTLFFGLHMMTKGKNGYGFAGEIGKVLTIDNQDVYNLHMDLPEELKKERKLREIFTRLNIDAVQMDAFKQETVDYAKTYIGDERALIFCDNGRKAEEFPLYASILKPGDIIMSHDWGTEFKKDQFDPKLNDILEPYQQEEFDKFNTRILSMIRK